MQQQKRQWTRPVRLPIPPFPHSFERRPSSLACSRLLALARACSIAHVHMSTCTDRVAQGLLDVLARKAHEDELVDDRVGARAALQLQQEQERSKRM